MDNITESKEVNRKPILVMLVGIPASGKTTVRKTIVERTLSKVCYISLDEIHNIIAQLDENKGVDFGTIRSKAINVGQDVFELFLATGLDIVIDATNLTVKSRKKWLNKAKDYLKIAYVLDYDLEECIERNSMRSEIEKVPEHVIRAMHSRFEMPTMTEGFDEVGVYKLKKEEKK